MVRMLRRMIPPPLRIWLRRRQQAAQKKLLRLDRVTDWSVLRRLQPYRSEFGRRRGQCVDRYYIEKFLASNQDVIRGRVAEIGNSEYTKRFGGDRVEYEDVLDLNERNERRTLTVDLARPDPAPEGVFDCIIATQVLLFVRDYRSAIRCLHKMLKEGGVLLLTVPGISPLVSGPLVAGVGEDWWRFTGRAASHEFGAVFSAAQVRVQTYGNVLTATALLHGLVSQELTAAELDYHDPFFEVIIGLRATKSSGF